MNRLSIILILCLVTAAAFSQPRTHKRVVVRSQPSRVIVTRPPVVVRQPRVIVRPSVYVPYRGVSYRYYGGHFYRPYGSYWRVGPPPIGIRVSVLPFGYMPLYVGPSMYYYNEGIYYRRYDANNYEVVDPPMGAELSSLPRGAKSVTVNGEDFYEYNGTYYKQGTNEKGKTVYTVTGKDGEINNTPEGSLPSSSPQIGDLADKLPEGSKTITLNKETYYVAPDDTYYKAIQDNDKTTYEVVGKPADTDNSSEHKL